jgi:hypothetical protein
MILSRHEGGSGSPLAQNFGGAIEDLWKSMDFLRKAGSEILSGPMQSRGSVAPLINGHSVKLLSTGSIHQCPTIQRRADD